MYVFQHSIPLGPQNVLYILHINLYTSLMHQAGTMVYFYSIGFMTLMTLKKLIAKAGKIIKM